KQKLSSFNLQFWRLKGVFLLVCATNKIAGEVNPFRLGKITSIFQEEIIMKKQLFLLFASATLLAACGNENGAENTTSTANDELKDTYIVGLDDTFAPMSFR